MRPELRKVLREPHDESRAHDNWDAIARRRHRTPSVPMQRPWLALALGVSLAAAGVLAMVGVPHGPGPLVRQDGSLARGSLETDVTLDDGSRITLDEGARLEVLENTGDHVRFWLHEGVAHFDVVPGGPRRWVIETGLVTVEVLGTAFLVGRTAMDVTVAVDRGSVLVRGPTAPDGMRRLGAGESLTLSAGEAPTVAQVEAPPSTPVAASTTTAHPRPRPATTTTVATADAVAVSPRLRDVDALRAAGRNAEAAALLDTIANDPSAGRERALAAFTRGRLELDRLAQPREAAAAFGQAISLGLREPLLEDARARRVEAFAGLSDTAGARDAADEYRRHYPEGRWSAEVERWSPAP